MTNVKLLKERITAAGVTQTHVAEVLGMTPQGLSIKIANGTDWTNTQIAKLRDLLRLSPADVDAIFFAVM